MSTSEKSNVAISASHLDSEEDVGWNPYPPQPVSIGGSGVSIASPASEWIALPFSEISNISLFRKPVWLAVERLYMAAVLADDCDCKRHEFSVNRNDLSEMGLRSEELKWLQIKDIVQEAECSIGSLEIENHRSDYTVASDMNAMFVISDLGLELFEEQLSADARRRASESDIDHGSQFAQRHVKPSWDNERHELCLAGKIVKKFKWRAANQEMILLAFEEEGWPAHIDDPLPQQAKIDPKRRLADAIKSLNRHQKLPLVRFCGDGTGEGVLWELT